MKRKIYFADLTHTAQGYSSPSFPLGISFVVSYAKKELGGEFDFELFKFPDLLDEALCRESPQVMCFSNYSWNFALAYKIASLAKAKYPKLVTVFGGPNFPVTEDEKKQLLKKRPAIDFYIELEGEVGFVDLIHKLMEVGFDVKKLKRQKKDIKNTTYVYEDGIVTGITQRIHDINIIPSPYLTGVLDPFFEYPLVPMVETTRGCPFSCTFCADGLAVKNKVHRYDQERTREELYYIAKKVKNVDELIITDLNYGMYQEDVDTALVVKEIKNKYQYPIILSASTGKNKPKRIIDVARILQGTLVLGASMQSNDPEVLKAIKRSNISSDAYKELIDFGNSLENSKTHTEFILGLPGDTKEKHFGCLRFGIENNVNNVRMYQAMLLAGTDMATQQTRERYGLITKFRTIPGCIGIYNFFGGDHPVAEIEEIIVGSKAMPIEDYIDCRIMNLIVETFHNNAIFEELFAAVRAMGLSAFDCLLYLKEHPELYSQRVKEIIAEFVEQTSKDLYDSLEEANNYVLTPEIIARYVGGELGINELLIHRALLFCEFEGISNLMFTSAKETLREKGDLNPKLEKYLDELKEFTILRKADIFKNLEVNTKKKFRYDFNEIRAKNYEIDPNSFPVLDKPVEFNFFHDDAQKAHITHQVNLYENTPSGMGRLIQRSNLKLMYRNFKKCTESTGGEPHLTREKLEV